MRAFTLIEVLVALGLFSVIAGLGLFMTMDTYRSSSVSDERDIIVTLLERARTRSMTNMYGTAHGFCREMNRYVVFRGVYAPETIEEYAAIGRTSSTGIPVCESAIVFTQLSGTTTNTLVTISDGVASSTIEINEEGAILW